MICRTLLIAIATAILAGCNSVPRNLPWALQSKRVIDRPFTIPKGLRRGLAGIGVRNRNRKDSGVFSSTNSLLVPLAFEFGKTDSRSFELIGVRLQIFKDEQRVVGARFGTQQLAIGFNSISGFIVQTEPYISLYYRRKISTNIALESTLFVSEEYRYQRDTSAVINEFQRYFEFGPLAQISDEISLGVNIRIENRSKIRDDSNFIPTLIEDTSFPIGIQLGWVLNTFWEVELSAQHYQLDDDQDERETALSIRFARYF